MHGFPSHPNDGIFGDPFATGMPDMDRLAERFDRNLGIGRDHFDPFGGKPSSYDPRPPGSGQGRSHRY